VYASFEKFGLGRKLKGESKEIQLPTTMTGGTFNGASAAKVRDGISERCEKVFSANSLHGELFVCVGADWKWSYRRP